MAELSTLSAAFYTTSVEINKGSASLKDITVIWMTTKKLKTPTTVQNALFGDAGELTIYFKYPRARSHYDSCLSCPVKTTINIVPFKH